MFSSLLRFWFLLEKERRIKFVLLSILMVFGSFAELLSISAIFPFIAFLTSPDIILNSSFVLDNPWIINDFSLQDLLLISSILFALLTLASGIIRLSVLYATTKYSLKTGMIINDNIFRRTLFQPYLDHTKNNSSETVSALTRKSDQICFNILIPCLNSINCIFQLLIVSIALFILDPITTTIAYSLFGSLYFLIIQASKKRLLEDGTRMAQEQQKLVKHMQEALGGIKDLIINNNQKKYLKYFKKSDESFKKAQGISIIIADSPRYIVETFGILIIIFLAYFLSTSMESFNSAVPILGTLALGAQRLLPIIQLTFRSWAYLKAGLPSLEDILKLLEKEDNSIINYQQKNIDFRNKISFRNVSFKYKDDSTNWILEDINLDIKKGEIIGIYGETGSGKSTFIDLLAGLIQPSMGSITIDGIDLDKHVDESWKSKLTYVPQNIFLIDATIKENVLFGNEEISYDKDFFESVLQKSKVNRFIQKLPQGLLSKVGERGLSLSGGERQRIGLARALYRNSEMLILDESTNSLDIETEKKIIKEIINLRGSKTIIMIAHRLSTLEKCDKYLHVKNGKITVNASL